MDGKVTKYLHNYAFLSLISIITLMSVCWCFISLSHKERTGLNQRYQKLPSHEPELSIPSHRRNAEERRAYPYSIPASLESGGGGGHNFKLVQTFRHGRLSSARKSQQHLLCWNDTAELGRSRRRTEEQRGCHDTSLKSHTRLISLSSPSPDPLFLWHLCYPSPTHLNRPLPSLRHTPFCFLPTGAALHMK